MNESSFNNLITNYLEKEVLLDKETLISTKLALLDTIGCIFDAADGSQPVAFATRGEHQKINNPFKHAQNMNNNRDIGRYFTTLIRWHDYNDTFLAREWAHPSDNIGSLFAYFMSNSGSHIFRTPYQSYCMYT